MTRYGAADVAHVASTDHRVLRRPEAKAGQDQEIDYGGMHLTLFGRDRVDLEDRQGGRNLGVALVQAASKRLAHPTLASEQAVSLLSAALRDDPQDVEAWEAKGMALMLQKRNPGALAALQEALVHDPQRERSLMAAATLAQELEQYDTALDLWRRAVAANPWAPSYRRGLALLLMEKQAIAEVRRECQIWMRLDPGSVEARLLWIKCLLESGDRKEAQAEFGRVEALQPPNLAALRDWWGKQPK
jgi:tetratricopeptide (TPR) repeat protein